MRFRSQMGFRSIYKRPNSILRKVYTILLNDKIIIHCIYVLSLIRLKHFFKKMRAM